MIPEDKKVADASCAFTTEEIAEMTGAHERLIAKVMANPVSKAAYEKKMAELRRKFDK